MVNMLESLMSEHYSL